MELRSGACAPAQVSTSSAVIVEMVSATDDMVHLIAEDDMVRGIVSGQGWYRAISGERVIAHASTASPGRRCSACRVAGQLVTPPSNQSDKRRRDGGHRRRCHTQSLVATLVHVLISGRPYDHARPLTSADSRPACEATAIPLRPTQARSAR